MDKFVPSCCYYLALLLCLSALCTAGDAFEYSAYCVSQCKQGRGGNLCKCNAAHFVGKRGRGGDTARPLDTMAYQGGGGDAAQDTMAYRGGGGDAAQDTAQRYSKLMDLLYRLHSAPRGDDIARDATRAQGQAYVDNTLRSMMKTLQQRDMGLPVDDSKDDDELYEELW